MTIRKIVLVIPLLLMVIGYVCRCLLPTTNMIGHVLVGLGAVLAIAAFLFMSNKA